MADDWVSSSDAKNWFETSSDADNNSWLKWEFTTPVIVTRIEWGKRYSNPWLGHDNLSNLVCYHRIALSISSCSMTCFNISVVASMAHGHEVSHAMFKSTLTRWF